MRLQLPLLGLLLRSLRLAVPKAPEEQQEEKDPGGSWHRAGRERIRFAGKIRSLLSRPDLALA